MKKTILTSIAAIAFAIPAIAANIPNDATCNSGVLGVSSGSANLEADYTANTINITWDGNGGSTPTGGATSCTYDSTFNLPTAPTKRGYTFAGWHVPQSCFANLSSVIEEELFYGQNYDAVNGRNGTWTTDLATGHTEFYGDPDEGEWEEEVMGTLYGTVTGISKCSSTNGTYATTGNPSDTYGRYCWCKANTYTPNGGSQCIVSTSSWVLLGDPWDQFDMDDPNDEWCSLRCAMLCFNHVRSNGKFRRAVFGLN